MPGKHSARRSTPARTVPPWLRQAGVAGIAGVALVATAVTQAVAESPDKIAMLSARVEPSALELTTDATVTEQRQAAATGVSRSAERSAATAEAEVTDPGEALKAAKLAADEAAAAEAARIAAERIAAEQAAAAENARLDAERQARANTYVLPTSGYRITGTFGATGMWSSGHSGLDFATSTGTPAVAVHTGTVVTVKSGGNCGRQVRIKHDDGVEALYCHLSVAVGARRPAGGHRRADRQGRQHRPLHRTPPAPADRDRRQHGGSPPLAHQARRHSLTGAPRRRL